MTARTLCLLVISLTSVWFEAEGAAIWRRTNDGLWSEATNWAGLQPPNVNLGSTYVTNAGTKTVTIDASTAGLNLLINSLTIAAPPGATNTLRLVELGESNPLALANNRFTMAGGGALEVNNSSLVVTGRFIDFNVWAGSITLNSGSIVAREFPLTTNVTVVTRLGRTNTARLDIHGGLMDVTQLLVGESPASQFPRSQGIIRMSGGTLNVAGEFSIGNDLGCTGIVAMTGGRLSVGNHMTNITRIGDFGFALMTVSNATVELANTSVARHDQARGLLVLQPDGVVHGADDFSIGRFSGATGSVYVAGGQLLVTNHPIWIGREGHGDLIVSNGFVHADEMYVAVVPTNTARGLLTLGGGRVLVSSNLVLGDASLSTGQAVLAAGELAVTNENRTALLTVASGVFTVNGGEVRVDHLHLGSPAGQLVLNGGSLISSATYVSNGLPFTVGDGLHPAKFRLDGGTHVFAHGLVVSSNATVDVCGAILGTVINRGTLSTNCGSAAGGPVITQQPLSQTVTPGSTVVFRVTATGTDPLSYQWRHGVPGQGGGDLAGALEPTLRLDNVQLGDAGNYRVIVSNAVGTATSVVATLRVLIPPSAISPVINGTSFSLSFMSVTGLRYFLEYRDSLDAPGWTPVDAATGTGELLQLRDPAASAPTRFYRLRVE